MEDKILKPYKYFAFISYSHCDKSFAKKLHTRLENYNIASVTETDNKKQKLYPVCRDETAFTTGNLDSIIKEKLKESKKLIVICTRESATSEYVREEVNFFAENFGVENIIPVICEKYFTEEERIDLLPGILKESANEKLDIYRFEGTYRQMFLKIVSGVLDIEYEAVEKRDRQRAKKRIAVISVLCAVAMCLLLTASLFGIRFFKERIISRDVEAAKKLCEERVFDGLESLLSAGEEARKWHLSTESVQNAVREYISYERGATLKKESFLIDDDNRDGVLSYNRFLDSEKTLIFYRGKVVRVSDMKVLIETDTHGFVYHGDDGEDVKCYYDNLYLIQIDYINKNNKFVICMSGVDGQHIILFDTATKEAEHFDKYKGIAIGLWEIVDDCIYFSYDGKIMCFNTTTTEISVVRDGGNIFAAGKKGKVYTIDDVVNYKAESRDGAEKMYISPDEKMLFVMERGKLFAYNSGDMSYAYSFDLPHANCDMVFEKDNCFVYSYITEENVLYPSNMFYINFITDNGKFISGREISFAREEADAGAIYVNNFFDTSDNGKNLVYNVSNTSVNLEDTEKDDIYEFEFDSGIINLAFYGDGEFFKVMLANGEVYTIAAKAEGSIRNLKCSQMISDRDDIGNIIVAEGNILARPINYGTAFKRIFEGDGHILFAGQTKDYFIFRSVSDNAEKVIYYSCNKKSDEIAKYSNADFLEVYKNKWDYDKNIVFDCNSDMFFDLSKGKSVKGETRKEKVSVEYEDGDNVISAFVEGKEILKFKSMSEDGYLAKKESENAFVLCGRDIILKYDMSGKELFRKNVTLMSLPNVWGEMNDGVISFDSELRKVCYTDEKENAFIVVDTETGKEIYRFNFTENMTCHVISCQTQGEKMATFSKDGQSVFFTYTDTKENVCKTRLVNLKNGKITDLFDGYPIIFTDYFEDYVIINRSPKNISSLDNITGYKYNSYKVVPVFMGYEDMVEKVMERTGD